MSQNLAVLKNLNTGNITAYINSVMAIPVLDADEEKFLLKKYFEENCFKSVEKLIIHHLKLVVTMARKYSFKYQNLADLIQVGNVGLMKSIKGFNHTINIRLSSFAYQHIKSEIMDFLVNNHKIYKIATTKEQRKVFFNYAKVNKLKNSVKTQLTYKDYKKLADELGVGVDDVINIDIKMSNVDYSLEGLLDEDDVDNSVNYPKIANQLAVDSDPIHDIEQTEYDDTLSYIKSCVDKLDDRKKDIINSRYFTDNPVTLTALAAKYSISVERVRQLEADAISKIKSLCGDF